MNSFKIVADSAADLTRLDRVPFAAAPLKIVTDTKEYTDAEGLDVPGMVSELKTYRGRSSSSCPSPVEWLNAFGDAKYILGVTLTSGLSGSYNSAEVARQMYEADHPDRRVFILDSLSAGPGETLLVEKLEELVTSGLGFEDICREITAYRKKTGVMFMLESLTNFANNGRVSPAVAKLAGFLGINIVGKASDEGTLEPTDKCRGQKRSLDTIEKRLKEYGYSGGKLLIAHCFNPDGAQELKDRILKSHPHAAVRIYATKGLCSYYAEQGGLLVGYEKH